MGQCPFPALLFFPLNFPGSYLFGLACGSRISLPTSWPNIFGIFIRRAVNFWVNMGGIIFMILPCQRPPVPSALFLNFLKFYVFLKFIHRYFIFLLHLHFISFIFNYWIFDIYNWCFLIHYPLFIYWERYHFIYPWLVVQLRVTLSFDSLFSTSGIIGICDPIWFIQCWGSNPCILRELGHTSSTNWSTSPAHSQSL